MGNEILAAILWGVSIPVVVVLLWVAVFFGFLRGAGSLITGFDNAKSIGDFIKTFFTAFWPIALAWLIGAIWVIIAVINLIVHVVAAFQIGAAG